MIDPESLKALSTEIRRGIERDQAALDSMRSTVRALKGTIQRIQPRSATAISLVGTDGGNNKLSFDPFLLQIIRVVDSSDNEYCLEVITPSTDFSDLNKRHICAEGKGQSPLGRLVEALGQRQIQDLSPVFRTDPADRSPSWVQVYREISEWAVVLDLVRNRSFGTDTIILCDGFLRSKMFRKGLFGKFQTELERAITRQFELFRRRIYLVGIAKHSKVLQKYRLAMAIEGVLRVAYPAFLPVPTELQADVYRYDEYATGGGEGESFVAGDMFLVKFGNSPYAPIWAVDIFRPQSSEAQKILGFVLADCVEGFPIPSYPQSLQRAHEKAALVDFDMDLLQDQICTALRESLGAKKWVIDELALQEADPSGRRYH